MVIYSVRWSLCDSLAKGKGRALKNECLCAFSVICRNNKDALSCLDYHFKKFFVNSKFSIDDGEVSLSRRAIDSRNFHADYLMMDGIREPIILSDLKSNILRFHQIFH